MTQPAVPRLAPPLDCEASVSVALEPMLDDGWPADGLGPVPALVSQLPEPRTLPPGAWLAFGTGTEPRGRGLGRLLRRGSRSHAHLAVRCTALLLRGYTHVCADAQGVAFGQVPRES